MSSSINPAPKTEEYGIAWICTLDCELAAGRAMLDYHHRDLQEPQDNNAYVLGSVGRNNVVIARLADGRAGTSSAATGVTELLGRFSKIRFGILIGIGGGVPGDKLSVHLGDVVIGTPNRDSGGMFQYSHEQTIGKGTFEKAGVLVKQPPILVAAVQSLKSDHMLEVTKIQNHLESMVAKYPDMQGKFSYPGPAYDTLFDADYEHPASNDRCHTCDKSRAVDRMVRYSPEKPKAHYGTIASGDKKMQRGTTRNQLARQEDVFCFETAAFGLMNTFPCLVLRGICDYADSHSTNKLWNEYAAATAAAYAKELVLAMPPDQFRASETAVEFMVGAETQFAIPFIGLPYSRVRQFVGRSNGLEMLEQLFLPLKETWRGHPKVIVLHGAGGIGKTQMAIEFARRNSNKFSAVFWIDAGTKERLRGGLSAMLDQIPLEAPSLRRMVGPLEAYDESIKRAIRIVARWLALPKNHKWLIIFDNVDEQNWPPEVDQDDPPTNSSEAKAETVPTGPETYDIRTYLDLLTQGSVLITTRSSSIAGEMGQTALTEALGQGDSLDMLKSLDPRTEHERRDAQQLVDALHNIPLALVFAAPVMTETSLTSRQYLHKLNEQLSGRDRLLAANPRLRDYDPVLAATWELALAAAIEESPRAVELMWVFSLLYHGDLFHGLFRNATLASNHWLHGTNNNSETLFQSLIDVLVKFEFVQLNAGDESPATYSMHPLVQAWCHDRLEPEEQGEYLFRAFDIMARAIPDPPRRTRHEHMFRRRLLTHADRLLAHYFVTLPEAQGRLNMTLRIFGNLLADAGRLDPARRVYERALPACRVEFTGDRNLVALVKLLCRLASVYRLQDRVRDAGAMLHQVVLVFEASQLWGRDHLPYVLTAIELAEIYTVLGDYAMAQKILVSLTYCELDPPVGEEYAPIATAMMDLAALLKEKGQLAEAATLYRLTIQSLRPRLGADHKYMFQCMGGLGAVYEAQGQHVAAAEEYQNALIGLSALLGPGHEKTSVLSLALYNLRQPMSAEARRTLICEQRTMVTTESANTPDPLPNRSMGVVTTKLNLGISLAAYNLFPEAGVLLKTVHRAAKRYFRHDRGLLISALCALGDWHVRQGQLVEARTRLQSALDIAQDIYDRDDVRTIDLLGWLGDVYAAEGDLDQAEKAYERAVESMNDLLGPDSLDAMLIVYRLGCIYRRRGRVVDAEAEIGRAVRCFEDVLGLRHPQTVRATDELRTIREEEGIAANPTAPDPSAACQTM
ncbi:hypothetical protein B0T22DRAFT_512391 [Podospora appendiculata]|uniref:Kinesin light chain n=1 Tax=Podospora appendiculata TaxID=314037 RepID=A0AAE1CCN0_9PEZI|nr:hypothetical protein B0T22DRAFT_512391 [Podospora appendiculata]